MATRIKDLLAEALKNIETTVEDEDLRSKIMTTVRPLLKKVENEAYEIIEDKKLVEETVPEMKTSIRDLKTEQQQWGVDRTGFETKITELEGRLNDPDRDKLVENLQTFKTQILTQKREGFISNFTEISKHENFEKVKDMFHIPEDKPENKNEDGTLKWDSVEDDKMEHNVNKFDEYNKIGYFGEIDKPSPDAGKGDKFQKPGDKKPKTIQEARQAILDQAAQ